MSKRSLRLILYLVVPLLALGSFGVACGDDDDSRDQSTSTPETPGQKKAVITLGNVESLTGSFGTRGTATSEGLKVAVYEINKAGGFIVGDTTYTFEIELRDARTDANVAVAAATELIRDEKVKFLFGPLGAGAVPVAQISQKDGVINFNATSAVETLLTTELDANRGLFKSGPPAAVRDPVWAQIVLDNVSGVKKAALIFSDDATSSGILPTIQKALETRGIEVRVFKFPADQADFSSILTQAKSFGADLLWIGYNPTPGLAITRQAEELNVGTYLAASSFPASLPLKDAIGKPISRPFVLLFAGRQFDKPTTDSATKFTASYKEATGKAIQEQSASSDTVFYYDTLYMLVKAMQKANSVSDSTKIIAELEKLHYKGMSGDDLHFDANHRLITAFDGCLVKSGALSCKSYSAPAQ